MIFINTAFLLACSKIVYNVVFEMYFFCTSCHKFIWF